MRERALANDDDDNWLMLMGRGMGDKNEYDDDNDYRHDHWNKVWNRESVVVVPVFSESEDTANEIVHDENVYLYQ